VFDDLSFGHAYAVLYGDLADIEALEHAFVIMCIFQICV